jgi:prepilin-type N-terminal cleavage/methylation domain-containing protein
MAGIRDDGGMTLIELLIAIVVLALGVTALVAGLGSGLLSIQRGGQTSIAGTLADKQMENYRQLSWSSIPATGLQTPTTATGSDNHTYWLQANIDWTCPFDTSNPQTEYSSPPTCSGATASRPVKFVTIVVRDGSSTGKVLFSENSTFDASTG